ncbi:MAG: NAD(P)H-hydrate epimerase [Actinomycetaceae bacterium]|nr:NAD(P)H-hydrate epimerase [Actinomycetaceae bacterium]
MLRAYASEDVRRAEATKVAAAAVDTLMKQAADAVASEAAVELTKRQYVVQGSTVVALVGGGNNGGDALYAASFLAGSGAKVRALLLTAQPHSRALAAASKAGVEIVDLTILRKRTLVRRTVAEAAFWGGVWIDGIVGTGAKGPLRGIAELVVDTLNAERDASPDEPIVIAVDLPSGINPHSGEIAGPVLRADVTVTMGAAKSPALLPQSSRAFGRLVVVDLGIGIPGVVAVSRLAAADVADLWLVPGIEDHKYTRGVPQIIAGSEEYPMTGVLCALGAARAGAGMVRLDAPDEAQLALITRLPEVVTRTGRFQSLLVGPGISGTLRESKAVQAAGEAILAKVPVVIDAGALKLVSEIASRLPKRARRRVDLLAPRPLSPLGETTVLTPHAGEAAALATRLGYNREQGGVSRNEIQSDPAKWARLLAEVIGATVLVKGHTTVISGPNGELFSQADAPTWAGTAGSGDVLAGILAAVLAMRQAFVEAGEDVASVPTFAAAAAWVHGSAATIAADAEVGVGHPIIASDIAAAVPRALGRALGLLGEL